MRTTLVLLTLTLAGCGTASPPGPGASERAPTKTTLDRDPAKPVAVVQGALSGTSLGLISLRRYGPKVVTAKVRLFTTRDAPTSFGTVEVDLDGDSYHDVSGMRLVDEVNGREHYVLKDSDDECLCSTYNDRPTPGSSVDYYAKFPGPPKGVTEVSLHVPGFPSFDNVRIAP